MKFMKIISNFVFPQSVLDLRINNNRDDQLTVFFRKLIEDTNFTTDISDIKQYLSPYRTFFDGKNFYYDEEVFEFYEEKQRIEIIMNEYFNFFTLKWASKHKIDNNFTNKTMNENLLYLYMSGLTKNKVWYAQDYRSNLIERYIGRFGELDVIVFGPNENARSYLFQKLLEGDEDILVHFHGHRIEDDNYTYIEAVTSKIFATSSGMYFTNPQNYDYKTRQYDPNCRIIVYDKIEKRTVKFQQEKHGNLPECIKIMEQLTRD